MVTLTSGGTAYVARTCFSTSFTTSPGAVGADAADGAAAVDGAGCAEQPRHTSRRTKNARRANITRNRLNMRNNRLSHGFVRREPLGLATLCLTLGAAEVRPPATTNSLNPSGIPPGRGLRT